MRRQLVPGPVVRLTVIKAKTRPGIEANYVLVYTGEYEGIYYADLISSFYVHVKPLSATNIIHIHYY